MRMLITGGAGFIGSHLCEKYVREGHTVLCLDNFLSGNLNHVRHLLDCRNFKLIKGDVRDEVSVEKTMRDVEAVFHLAAQVHVDRSCVEPRLTWDTNVMGTQNILETARMHDVRKVLLASSSEVYGSALYAPIDEKHPLNSPHPYGASKIAADRMAYAYSATYGMDIAIMRLFNVYGPRQRDQSYGGVISVFARRVLSGVPPMIYGDGLQTRDYTYVSDAVRAYDAALKHGACLDGPVNFGAGKEISILALAEMIVELCGKNGTVRPVHVDSRIGEVKRLIADASRARDLFGWEPETDFRTGLRLFVEWYARNGFEERCRLE
jgi:UDP-glucose 4-epimerase